MVKQVTFIHAADLHLGAPFRGVRALSDAWASRLLSAIPEAYDRVVEAALSRKVDFVIFAGDIFDSTRASYRDYYHFFEGLKRLDKAGIWVYLCTGNHDPYTSWQYDFFALPSHVVMLEATKPSFDAFRKNGQTQVLIGGRGYYNQTWPVDEDISEGITRSLAQDALRSEYGDVDEAPFAVGVLHTGLDLDMAKAPTKPAKLLSSGMDYWALGHIHKKYVRPSLEDPRLAFSGCIQGRDINETGERGCFLVTLTQGKKNELEFIPTASVVWQRLKVDVSLCANVGEVADLIMRELFRVNGKAHCEEMCARVTLKGSTLLHGLLKRPGVIDDLRKQVNDSYPLFFCDALVNATKKPRDKKALEREGLFPAVFLQVATSLRERPDEQLAFLQEAFLKNNLYLPSSYVKSVDELAREAEEEVLDLLDRDEQ